VEVVLTRKTPSENGWIYAINKLILLHMESSLLLEDKAAQRLAAIRATIDRAAHQAGRKPEEIRLVAVSKTHGAELVRAVADAGQRAFGESRVQEAAAKIPSCPGSLEWHFIGHLQKNKIRKALALFDYFHGIDSLELAGDLNRIADETGQHPKILLEVNTSGESSKFGFRPDQIAAQIEDLLALPRLEILGFMTMAPVTPKPEMARLYFSRLRELRDEIEQAAGISLPELSMGMSGDYEQAILEGSTMVRVGTALFGDRGKTGE
jgi:pyridoxal phosphate enzyme (YggS family)